jgi:uncharacterized protein YndB with AHSA1/START domain
MESTATTATAVQTYRVYIKATPRAIWDALTQAEWSDRYGYCGLVDYDLRPGGRFCVRANEGMKAYPGVPDVIVDGEVLEVDAPRRLVQTWRMLMDPSLAAEGFTRLTCEIEEGRGGVTRLTMTHDLTGAPGLAALVGGEFEAQGAGGGWSEVLSGLKTLLETGAQLYPQSGTPSEECAGGAAAD